MAKQLPKHLEDNTLLESCQSVYRPCHSKETVLLGVQSDIVQALNGNKCFPGAVRAVCGL